MPNYKDPELTGSHGWEDCAWRSSILDASDKSHIVIGFLSADFGEEGIPPAMMI